MAKINPLVFNDVQKNNQNNPEEQMYLLLLVGNSEEDGEYREEWTFVMGRTAARQYIIDNIESIEPKRSYVLVGGSSLSLNPSQIPTVYQLFTDPRSSWSNPELFPDGFDINQEFDDYGEDEDPTAVKESQSSVEAVNEMMAKTDGIDV